MARNNEFNIEVTKDQFEKVINDLDLNYSEPMDYFRADDGYVFNDYWHHENTGLTLAMRFNGYRDKPDDDPTSKPRYFITESAFNRAAKKAGEQEVGHG